VIRRRRVAVTPAVDVVVPEWIRAIEAKRDIQPQSATPTGLREVFFRQWGKLCQLGLSFLTDKSERTSEDSSAKCLTAASNDDDLELGNRNQTRDFGEVPGLLTDWEQFFPDQNHAEKIAKTSRDVLNAAICKKFRVLSLGVHPDQGGDPIAFQALTTAKARLLGKMNNDYQWCIVKIRDDIRYYRYEAALKSAEEQLTHLMEFLTKNEAQELLGITTLSMIKLGRIEEALTRWDGCKEHLAPSESFSPKDETRLMLNHTYSTLKQDTPLSDHDEKCVTQNIHTLQTQNLCPSVFYEKMAVHFSEKVEKMSQEMQNSAAVLREPGISSTKPMSQDVEACTEKAEAMYRNAIRFCFIPLEKNRLKADLNKMRYSQVASRPDINTFFRNTLACHLPKWRVSYLYENYQNAEFTELSESIRDVPSAVQSALRGFVCFKTKDYQSAQDHWVTALKDYPYPASRTYIKTSLRYMSDLIDLDPEPITTDIFPYEIYLPSETGPMSGGGEEDSVIVDKSEIQKSFCVP